LGNHKRSITNQKFVDADANPHLVLVHHNHTMHQRVLMRGLPNAPERNRTDNLIVVMDNETVF
jgi:hypothetical protein